MNNTSVIMNEQHTLLPEQEVILDDKFPGWELLKVPANGWTLEEMKAQVKNLCKKDAVVFVSPLPYMLKTMSENAGFAKGGTVCPDRIYATAPKVFIFHNDNREKKEINGKIISVTAKTGWVLL